MTAHFNLRLKPSTLLATLFAFIFSFFSPVESQGQEKDDPFRVLVVPNDQVDKLLEKKLQTPHRLLSVSEFQNLKKGLTPTSRPLTSANLVNAVYEAGWNGSYLAGKAKWTLDFKTADPFFIPLDNLNLAIKNFDTKGSQGWMGEWENGKYSLFAPRGNLRNAEFDWTIPGKWSLQGFQVQMKIPPSPSGNIEIIHTPDWDCILLSRGILQTSNSISQPGKKATLLTCSGESTVDLLFTSTNSKGFNKPWFSSLVSKHQIKESHCISQFELTPRPDSNYRGDLTFETSTGLEITEVVSQAVQQWQYIPGERNKKGALKISLANSGTPNKPILIHGFHHPVDQSNPWWVCPSLENSNKRPIPEQITVTLDHGMLVEEINHGDFTPTPATNSDPQLLMNFQGGAFSANNKVLAHPSIRFTVQPSKFQSIVYSNFSPEIGKGLFFNAAYLKVLHGAIQFFSFEIPRDYKVESLGINRPDNKIRDWSAVNSANKQILRIELEKPIVSLDSPEQASILDLPCITVNLSTTAPASKLRDWAFPFFNPLYASSVEGFLGITSGNKQQKIAIRTDFNPTTMDYQNFPLLREALAVFKYSDNPPAGFADLSQVKGLVKSHLGAKHHLSDKELVSELMITITPETGSVNFIDIITPQNLKPDQWDWHCPEQITAIAKIEKIPSVDPVAITSLVGNTNAAGKLGALALLEKNLVWRIHFARPISGNQAILIKASWKTHPWSWPVHIPLVFLRDEILGKMEVAISTAESILPDFQTKDAVMLPGDRMRSATFLVQSPSSLISIQEKKHPSPPGGIVSNCEILKSISSSGQETQSVQADICFWNSDFFQIQLPEGSSLIEVWMDGKQFPGMTMTGNKLLLPIPQNSNQTRVFVKYSLPFHNRWLWEKVPDKGPVFPVEPLQKKVWWIVPDGWTALTNGSHFSGIGKGNNGRFSKSFFGSSKPIQSISSLNETSSKSRITVATNTISETLAKTLTELNTLVPDLVIDSFAIRNAPAIISPGVYPVPDLLKAFGLRLVPFGNMVLLTSSKTMGSPILAPGDFGGDTWLEYFRDKGSDTSGRFLAAWNLPGLLAFKATNSSDMLARELSAIPMETTGITGDIPKFILFIFHTHRLFAIGSILGLCFYFQAKKHLDLKTNISWIAIPVLFATCMILAPVAITPLLMVPFLVLTILELFWFWKLVRPKDLRDKKTHKQNNAITMTTLVFAWICLNHGFLNSQTTLPDVFFLPPNPEKIRDAGYLVPEALLKANKSPSGKAIIEKSIYKGTLTDNVLNFSFIMTIQSTGPCQLGLPFKGIWFKDNLVLNGEMALNSNASGDPFIIQIPSSGSHRLSGEFKTQTNEKPSGNSTSFQVPNCLQSELSCDFGTGAESVASFGFDGAYEITRQGTKTLLTADLGKTNQPVTIQWEKPPLKPRELPVLREAYHWTISPTGAYLKCFWDLQTSITGTDLFEFAIPHGLQMESVEVSRKTQARLAISKMETRTGSGYHRVIIHLNQRILGNLQISCNMVPLEYLGGKWEILLPKPVGTFKENSCYLAYNALNCEVSKSELPLGITGVNAVDYAPFWTLAEKPIPMEISFAGVLAKEPSARTGLFLNISKAKQSFDISQKCSVILNPHQMTMDFDLVISNSPARLSYLEWDLDSPYPMTLNSLGGDSVFHWQQSGRKILIWLKSHPPNFNLLAKASFSPPFQNQEFSLEMPSSSWKGSSMTKTILHVAPMWGFARSVKINQGYEIKNDLFETNRRDSLLRLGFKARPLIGKVDSFLRNRTTNDLKQLQLDLVFSNLNQDDCQFLLNLEKWPNQAMEWITPENAKVIPLTTGPGSRQFLITFRNKTSRPQVIQGICQRPENMQANLLDWSIKGVTSTSRNNLLDLPDPLNPGEKVPSAPIKDDRFFLHQIDLVQSPESGCELFSTWWIGGANKDLEIRIPPEWKVEALLINGQKSHTDSNPGLIRIASASKPGFHVVELACRTQTQMAKLTPKNVPIIRGQPTNSIITRFFSSQSTRELKPASLVTYQLAALSGIWDLFADLKKAGTIFEGLNFATEITGLVLFKAECLNRATTISADDLSITRSIGEKMLEFPKDKSSPPHSSRLMFSTFNHPLASEGLLADTESGSSSKAFQIHPDLVFVLCWFIFGIFLFMVVRKEKYHGMIHLFWPELLLIAGLLYGFIPYLDLFTPTAIALWLVIRVWKVVGYLIALINPKSLRGT